MAAKASIGKSSRNYKKGFTRVRVDGELYDIEELPTLDKNLKHDIEVVVDRIVVWPDMGNRVADSLKQRSGSPMV